MSLRFGPAILAVGWLTAACPQSAPACASGLEPETTQAKGEVPASPPGGTARTRQLAARLWTAYQAMGSDYQPRTEHLRADGSPVYVNRLIFEDSPYLLQHAHNPVDWYPWGPEAFERAEREGKPIFLSIGYSTCHWCHVMESESFDHEETARLMNELFVNIKVDREQRPDVDEVYMTAVQLISGRGGWPMSNFLTTDGKPFFGATYFPRETFQEVLRRTADAWRDQRSTLIQQATAIADRVAKFSEASGEAVEVGREVMREAIKQSLSRHDDRLGGFSRAPKFPHEPELFFLLDRVLRADARQALVAVETSLDRMARGGIYDQIGGGFHRYSTDSEWLVPHFEKMLYNQAHLARIYLEASMLAGNFFFERVARQTLDYVLRDMTSAEGGFYSATDADSEGREGEFFVWTPQQIRAALSPSDAALALRVFGVTESGNFEGKNILHLPVTLQDTAVGSDQDLDELLADIDRVRSALYHVRDRRIHPLRDEKIVTSWNAMMITTLVRAGEALAEERYLEAALRAESFLWKNNRRGDGRLWRAHLAGTSSVEASQNDYAYLVEALVTLYDVTADDRFLDKARAVADVMVTRFWHESVGGFYMSEDDHEGRLPVRPKSSTDGAIPSGNSVAVRALAMLAQRTGDASYRRRAEQTVAAFSSGIRLQPTAFAYMLLGVGELLDGGGGALEYGARGAVRATGSVTHSNESAEALVTVRLAVADGWHVNSNRPLDEFLIPTRLSVENADMRLEDVSYPEAESVRLGFQDEPLSVFRGDAEIQATVDAKPGSHPEVLRLGLTLQACDDEKCLEPETLSLELARPR